LKGSKIGVGVARAANNHVFLAPRDIGQAISSPSEVQATGMFCPLLKDLVYRSPAIVLSHILEVRQVRFCRLRGADII